MWRGVLTRGKRTTAESGKSAISSLMRRAYHRARLIELDSAAEPRKVPLADGSAGGASPDRAAEPRRGAHRGALRPLVPRHRGGAPERAQPLRRLLRRRQDPHPAAPRGDGSLPQVLEPGQHAVPRARAPAPLRPRAALQGVLPARARVRSLRGDLPARTGAARPAALARAARRRARRAAAAGPDGRPPPRGGSAAARALLGPVAWRGLNASGRRAPRACWGLPRRGPRLPRRRSPCRSPRAAIPRR